MNLVRLGLRTLGKRLAITSGELTVAGATDTITIRRDRFGVPHIEASSDADAWFGLGFCQGQDRAFQLEIRLRLVRGTLAALIGPDALPIDRISRRIGLRRHGEQAVAALPDDHRERAEAFAAGVTVGSTRGLPRRAHPFALLRSDPTPFEAADAFGFLAFQAFALAANWDVELARLRMLALDGADAVLDLEPPYPADLPVSDRPGEPAARVVEALAGDIETLAGLTGLGGGSNNWAIAGSRTASGRPIVANDPHLAPLLPPHWYLAHLTTPDWSLAGATLPATPSFGAGHNGHGAWGVTAGLIDNTDLFLEEIGPDGRSVRRGDSFVPCEVRTERIEVKGGDDEVFDVLETDRGPIISPALEGVDAALSMAATWLVPGSYGGVFEVGRIRSFDELRSAFAGWTSIPLNVVYGEEGGGIGWQMVGSAPVRRQGGGTIPLPAWDPETGWEADPVPFAEMPHVSNPVAGFVATANNLPSTDGPYLGSDFLDGFRVARITETLAAGTDWDVNSTLTFQMDRTSIPWRAMRDGVIEALASAGDLGPAVDLLRGWDGVLAPDSAAATVFEMFHAEMAQRVAAARAPRSAARALGEGFHPVIPYSGFLVRRTGHLIRLLDTRPEGWFDAGWDGEMRDAMRAALRQIEERFGADDRRWGWGEVRRLTFKHPLGLRKPLNRVFDLGPMRHGGDANTINPAPVDPRDPLGNPDFAVASLRMVVDVGEWDRARFALPGGQSGNPYSPHYSDQLPLWQRGDGMALPFTNDAVRRAARKVLTLLPAA